MFIFFNPRKIQRFSYIGKPQLALGTGIWNLRFGVLIVMIIFLVVINS